MMAKRLLSRVSLSIVVVMLLAGQAAAGAKAGPDIGGWERGSPYDALYDPKEADAFKGRVTKILRIVPLPGMAPGVGIQVEDKKDKRLETVHLGPEGAVDVASIGLKIGDRVKVVGAWADVRGQDVLLAVKVKKDDGSQLKVRRTKDGFPLWSMTPQEIGKVLSKD